MTKPPKPGPGGGGGGPGPNNGEGPPESGMVYVLSTDIVNFCGHENHRASKCGGHLASIHNQEEMIIVMSLIQQDPTNSDGYWIGGQQDSESRNDEGPEDPSLVKWEWSDGTAPWFDNNGAYWKDGEPNNTIGQINGKSKGSHHVSLLKSAPPERQP